MRFSIDCRHEPAVKTRIAKNRRPDPVPFVCDPSLPFHKYDIDLWFTSRVIPAGHRLRVTVASGAFPKYDRNLNTGGDNERDTRYVVVRQRILHDKAHPSFVRLPIIPR